MTTLNTSQVGLEVWASPGQTGTMRATQVGAEVWTVTTSAGYVQASQVGLEVWSVVTTTGYLRASQVGLEVWASSGALVYSASTIWQSDPFPTSYSNYIEGGAPMMFDFETVLLPDNQQLRENLIIEANLDLASIGAQPVVTFIAEDTNDNPIQTLTLVPAGVPTLWDQFTWDNAPWDGTPQNFAPYQLAWTQPLVFKQAAFSATGVCCVGFRIGTIYLNFQVQGYQQQSRSGVN